MFVLALCVLFVGASFADVVDNEVLGTPYMGAQSASGCLRYINWSNQPPPTGTWTNGHVISPRCENGPQVAVRGWIHTNVFSAQTFINSTTPAQQRETMKERVRETFRNIKRIIRNYGANYDDVVKVKVETFDIPTMRPLVNEVQAEVEFWGPQASSTTPVYPNRAITGLRNFNGLDCLRADGTIYRGPNVGGQVQCGADTPIGDIVEITADFVHRRGDGPNFFAN